MMDNLTEDMNTWFAIYMLQNRYIGHLDNNRLEQWPEMFTEDCTYEIVPKENADLGLPVGIVHCTNRRMLRDRVVSLRHANIYEEHTYRHMTSGSRSSRSATARSTPRAITWSCRRAATANRTCIRPVSITTRSCARPKAGVTARNA